MSTKREKYIGGLEWCNQRHEGSFSVLASINCYELAWTMINFN